MNAVFKVAPFSATAWVWTITFLGGLLFFAVRAFLAGTSADLFDVGAAVLLGALTLYALVRSVRGYRVGDGQVAIVRLGPGRINIHRSDISSIEAQPDIGSFFNMSFLSIGGLFGWAGKARVRRTADLQSLDADVFGTNSAYAVLMRLKSGRTLILTPADPAGFVAAVRGLEPPAVTDKRNRRG